MSFATTDRHSSQNRISPVFLVLVAILGTSAWAVAAGYGNSRFGVFLFVVAGWMVSLCLHEYAHARTALHSGDISIGAKGYLTLNPFKYAHAMLSFVLPVIFVIMGGIGLPGGAVFIERHRIRGRLKHSLISAAGPLVNLVLGIGLLLLVGSGLFDDPGLTSPVNGFDLPVAPFPAALSFLAYLQITAAILNFLPVPGLDGYGIVEPWLSYRTRRAVEPFAPYGMLLLFLVIWQTEAGRWLSRLALWIMDLFGVENYLVAVGDALFRFWS
ncbi:site-2 protease family protein [Kitasatospora sp. NPDC048540]|uniref:site-2 protease family protein n=1 Tax=Kitasatospora sp. NPDC048540 TaxID=3155634 RepID=UPI0033FD35CE